MIKTLSFQVDVALDKRLKKVAQERDLTKSQILRLALRTQLARYEQEAKNTQRLDFMERKRT